MTSEDGDGDTKAPLVRRSSSTASISAERSPQLVPHRILAIVVVGPRVGHVQMALTSVRNTFYAECDWVSTNPTHVELVESVQLLRRLRSEAAGGELLDLQCTPSLGLSATQVRRAHTYLRNDSSLILSPSPPALRTSSSAPAMALSISSRRTSSLSGHSGHRRLDRSRTSSR